MGKQSHRDHSGFLPKTAIGLGDPVLLRLSNGLSHTLLLADGVVYDGADTIRLQNVRWVRAARGLKNLLPLKPKHASGFLAELRLGKSRDYITAAIASQPSVRVSASAPAFRWVALTHEKYMELRACSQTGFVRAARKLAIDGSRPPLKNRVRYSVNVALIQLRHLVYAPKLLAVALAFAGASARRGDR